jgi:hypothetical protein
MIARMPSRGRRALVASLAVNCVAAAAIVFLLAVDERHLASRLRGDSSPNPVAEPVPAISYRAEHRLSRTRREEGTGGEGAQAMAP